jgi:hypothetical protein
MYWTGGQQSCEATPGCMWDGGSPCVPDSTRCGGTNNANCNGGIIDVRVADNTQEAIHCTLYGTWLRGGALDGGDCPQKPGLVPGGYTPIGPTLYNINKDKNAAGLASADQPNFVMLLTDGAANCWNPGTGYNCNTGSGVSGVKTALDLLVDGGVRTYIVGTGITDNDDKRDMSCYAVRGGKSRCVSDGGYCSLFAKGHEPACTAAKCKWTANNCRGDDAFCYQFNHDLCGNNIVCAWDGGVGKCVGNTDQCRLFRDGGSTSCRGALCYWNTTPNPDVCEGVDSTSCENLNHNGDPLCYYQADGDAILTAFNTIAADAAGCDYTIPFSGNPDTDNTLIYLDLGDGKPVYYGGGSSGWAWSGNAVRISGAACDTIVAKKGTAKPVIVVPCAGGAR